MPEITVGITTTPAELEAAHKIRVEVFVDEQGFPADTEFDEIDDAGTGKHWLACVDGRPAGTIRLVPAKGKLTRLAVLKEFRTFGVGRVLVHALEGWVAKHAGEVGKGDGVVKIHSQMPVVKFYAKLGYREVGDVFDEEGEPHQAMERNVTK